MLLRTDGKRLWKAGTTLGPKKEMHYLCGRLVSVCVASETIHHAASPTYMSLKETLACRKCLALLKFTVLNRTKSEPYHKMEGSYFLQSNVSLVAMY
jgi:hypothetical protein